MIEEITLDTTIQEQIESLKNDILYFEKLGFNKLVEKFKRDLTIINKLSENKPKE